MRLTIPIEDPPHGLRASTRPSRLTVHSPIPPPGTGGIGEWTVSREGRVEARNPCGGSSIGMVSRMAIVHSSATVRPTKRELLESMLGGAVEVLGSYRFDDPAGEVGVEAF